MQQKPRPTGGGAKGEKAGERDIKGKARVYVSDADGVKRERK